MLEKSTGKRQGRNKSDAIVAEFETPNYEFIVQTIQTSKCVLLLGPDACLATDKIGRTTTFTRLTAATLLRSGRVKKYYKEEDLYQFWGEAEESEARYSLGEVFLGPYPEDYYEEIAQIPFHLIISSSPALCLQKTFERHRLPHDLDFFIHYGTPEEPPVTSAPSAARPLLYQISGSMQDPDSLILTHDDMFEYIAAIIGQQKLPNKVKTALLDDNVKHLILLGFQLDRWYVHLLLQLLQAKDKKIKSKLRTYAYSSTLPPHIHIFCKEQFNVSFVSTPPREFIHQLFIHAHTYAQTPLAKAGRFSLRPLLQQETAPTPEIFISYAWGGKSEEIVRKLYKALTEKGYNIILDKIHLGYIGRIKEFMQRLGTGHYIITVISDKYLRSENCMYEVLQMTEHKNIHQRIFPIVLDDASIYDPGKQLEYKNYWSKMKKELEEQIRSADELTDTEMFTEQLNLRNKIQTVITNFMALIKDMNSLTYEIHEESGFRQLMDAIDQRIETELNNGN